MYIIYLSNEMGKKDNMRGQSITLSLFRQEFNEFNDTGTRCLDSIYHMALKFIKNGIFRSKNVIILSIECNVKMEGIHVT